MASIKRSGIIIIAFGVVLLATIGISEGQFVGGEVNCQTNGGSPTVTDAQNLVNWLKGRGTCDQTNCGGNYCTTMGFENTAAISICTKGPGCCNCAGQQCSRIADNLQKLIDQCPSNGLVGGYYREYTRNSGGAVDYGIFHN